MKRARENVSRRTGKNGKRRDWVLKYVPPGGMKGGKSGRKDRFLFWRNKLPEGYPNFSFRTTFFRAFQLGSYYHINLTVRKIVV